MTRVYLDTSVISALFDERTPERKAQAEEAWSALSEYETCISKLVIDELSHANESLKQRMMEVIEHFTVLETTEEANALAQQYVDRGIFPERYIDDATHVAIAATNDIGILLSWNFSHLVKVKTRRLVALINTESNYLSVEIIAPPEL